MMLKRQYYLKKNDKSNRIEKQQSRFTVTPNEKVFALHAAIITNRTFITTLTAEYNH